MISEGLADHFSIEVTGVDAPSWSTALDGAALDTWRVRARDEWFDTGYDHGAWFFGEGPEIPRWAGYTIGFELVQAFLTDNPVRRASDLFDEPAAAFVPATNGR